TQAINDEILEKLSLKTDIRFKHELNGYFGTKGV
ncbi:unnamed protein product, partial [marine sediment metagenome]